MRGVRKAVVVAAAAAVPVAGGLTAAAAAPAQSPHAASTTVSAAQAHSHTYLKFTKNHRDQTKSKLRLVRYNPRATPHYKVLKTYRAGSGVIKNSCAVNRGWLPNGTYTVEFHQKNFNGSLIKGYVIKLADKRCGNGTPRTELFIHSEMTATGGQGATEPSRWDGPGDYTSNGCIKLNPANINNLFGKASHYGWPKKLVVH